MISKENFDKAWKGSKYRSIPFWSLNGKLEKDELLRQIDCMKEMGMAGFFLHSRTGLETEYLGEEWFKLMRDCAEHSAKIGMQAWLYDEDRWPSGSCGGLAAKDEKYRTRYLSLYFDKKDYENDPNVLCVLARFEVFFTENDIIKDYRRLKENENARAGYRECIFTEELMQCNNNFNSYSYIDTLNIEATNKFIELTHEKYKKYCGDMFGKEILGIFTDEPYRGQNLMKFAIDNKNTKYMTPYTGKLFYEYSKKYNEDLRDSLPEIFFKSEKPGFREVSYRYLLLINDLFIQNFAVPYYEWCKKNKLIVTGHVLHEDSLTVQTCFTGSLMRHYEFMDYPGIDNLGADNRCYWAVKQCKSVAYQLGKEAVLSEMYGCTGWHMSFDKYKQIADWQIFYGINIICEHLSWYTMKGQNKRDYPSSFLQQSGWHKDFPILQDYFARFQAVLSMYERSCSVLAVNPIETMYGYVCVDWITVLSPATEEAIELEKQYTDQFFDLTAKHIEFDYGDEEIMFRHGKIVKRGGKAFLQIGKAEYDQVLLIENMHLRDSTKELLDEFKKQGGLVTYDSSLLTPCPIVLSEKIALTTRKNGDELYLIMLNLNDKEAVENVSVTLPPKFKDCVAEVYDLRVGQISGVMNAGSIILNFAPAQEIVLKIVKSSDFKADNTKYAPLAIPQEMEYELTEENVLVLDYAVCSIDGKAVCGGKAQEVLAADRSVRDSLGLENRSGSMLQPWYAKKHLPDSYKKLCDLQLIYNFNIEQIPAGGVTMAIEESENMEISLNGSVIDKAYTGKWLDICFDKIKIPENLLKYGENSITIKRSFCRTDNIESIYLLGQFGVKVPSTLTKLPQKLSRGDITAQGLPFYTGSVKYKTGIKNGNYSLSFTDPAFALAKIHGAQGKPFIAFSPFEAKIKLKSELILECVFNRRNTFGPFHAKPFPIYGYGPDSYETKGDFWTDEYLLGKNGL